MVEMYDPDCPSLVERLKGLVCEGGDTFVYIIQGKRWDITQGPSRYLVNGNTRIALFDEDTPEIQRDGFLGTNQSELPEEMLHREEPVSVEPMEPEADAFSEDDYFENEPDYDESHDVKEA